MRWSVTPRRRGSAGRATEGCAGGRKLSCCVSFSFPADTAIFGVFQNYTTFGELLTNAVRSGKIAPLACRLPLRNQSLDFCVARANLRWAIPELAHPRAVLIIQHRKSGVGLPQHF